MGSSTTAENDPPSSFDAADPEHAASFEKLRFESTTGGLILLGPTPSPLGGLRALLASPAVQPIETQAADLSSWKTASAEIVSVTRQVSSAVRAGQTAVVYLDIHLGENPEVPEDGYDFVCARLGRILLGLADPPPYVVIHGQQLANALLVDSLGDTPQTIGMIADYLPVVQLTERTMFTGTPVAVCSNKRAATAVVQALDWFEARRGETRLDPTP